MGVSVSPQQLAPPPRLGVHDDLEAALDDEEEVDAQPDGEGQVQVAVVRVEFNLHQAIFFILVYCYYSIPCGGFGSLKILYGSGSSLKSEYGPGSGLQLLNYYFFFKYLILNFKQKSDN